MRMRLLAPMNGIHLILAVSLFLISGGIDYSFSEDVSISFEKDVFHVDEKITVTVNDPTRKHFLRVMVSAGSNYYEIDAYEVAEKPGTFSADFYLSSIITSHVEKISATYSYFAGNQKLVQTREAKVFGFAEKITDEFKTPIHSPLTLRIVDANDSTVKSGTTGDELFVSVTGNGNIVMRVVNLLSGIELMKWGVDKVDTSYTPYRSGLYRFIATEFSGTNSQSIFEDVLILEAEKQAKKPSDYNPDVFYNNENLMRAMSVQPSVITNHYNLSNAYSLEQQKQLRSEPSVRTYVPQNTPLEKFTQNQKIKQKDVVKNYTISPIKGDILDEPKVVDVTIPPLAAVPGCHETNSCFIPPLVSINTGNILVWTNMDATSHTVTSGNPEYGFSGKFDSGPFLSGRTFSFVFDEPGTIDYHCTIHPWMQGKIIINKDEVSTISEHGILKPKDTIEQIHVDDTESKIKSGKNQRQTHDSKDISCEGKVLVQRTNGKIACVTQLTAEKLSERGWQKLN